MSEQLPPPSERIPILRWLHQNLFSSWFNAILTVAAAALIGVVAFGLLKWALGARWAVIPANLKLLMVGTYPAGSIWRVWTAVYVLTFMIGWRESVSSTRRLKPYNEKPRERGSAGEKRGDTRMVGPANPA